MYLGIDIGSTTMKTVLCDTEGNILHTDYRRHNTDIPATATAILADIEARYGETDITLALTGSVGMGYAESLHCTFVQEVICAAEVIKARYPQVKTLIDIGGEDSKMIFFEEGRVPDIRMNGNCAGGTGAFIDQTASLIGASPADIGTLARRATCLHPIASRCGVFAKTDIQNLLSRDVSRSDIAASVLDSVSRQVVTSLARGTTIRPAVFMCGGPFAFIPQLRESMRKVLSLKDEECIVPEHAQFIPAWGAALYARRKGGSTMSLPALKDFFADFRNKVAVPTGRLEPLFTSQEEYRTWFEEENIMRTGKAVLDTSNPGQYWLGVDSGSTTTKAVLLDSQGRIVYTDYLPNEGDSLGTFSKIIKRLTDQSRNPDNVRIVSSCVTGYGEDLLRGTFGLEQGIVETMAHYTAAREVSPQVSFVLDIGGQDMKAIFCGNGSISRMELNEACSSGCGSFLENFAASLGYNIGQFADMACFATHPCDLGSRCTVFMNSKVKQAMREGATAEDIAAGFSYSVVRNCLFKVLKLKNLSELGEHVVVQGGTFRNHSIIRALEKTLGLRVSFSDIPELMGAYGCALYAMRTVPATAKDERSLTELALDSKYSARTIICSGCTNHCKVKEMTFRNGNVYYSGNNCEKVFHNGDRKAARKGVNMLRERYHLLFDRASGTDGKSLGKVRIGIPRGLGIYEDFPFWHTLLTECGMQPVLSSPSSTRLYTSGIRYTMSDNICFPAKLMHGHVMDLLQKKVDRILYPYVVYERKDDAEAGNSYNCPIVSGYSEFIPPALQAMGYKAISLAPGCQADVDNGLRYANNDICYPATIVVGSIMNYLHHCGLPHDQLAVVMYQTGGQCRATNYFALIQNAMIADGFSDVPVISISPSANIHANQPGFTIDWKHNAKLILHTVLYADCLSKMYHSAIAREKHEGDADRIRAKFTALAQQAILSRDCAALRTLITDAAREFASAIRTDVHPPVIGVVGEIYVKYNSFSNKNVIHWLNSHGIETVSPTICGFFTTAFANRHINRKLHIRRYDTPAWVSDMLYRWIRHYAKAFDKACSPYPLYQPFTDIFDDARAASRIVNLAGDFGEGWYLPAEIANLAAMGVKNVVSLQPFGCIANHVISKGIEKRLKQLYPQMSFLFLDFDSNTSEANVYNRLHFLLSFL